MKKYLLIILTLGMLLATSCRRSTDNGKIDGLWRIDTIEYTGENPRTINPDNLFFAAQLELFQLCAPSPVSKATAMMTYSEKEGTLGLEFPDNPEPTLLMKFGIPSNPCVLRVEHISSKHLVLKTSGTVISCTHY